MRTAIVAACITITVISTGCYPKPASVSSNAASYSDPSHVQWLNAGLGMRLSVENVQVDRANGGLLRVRAAVRNKKNSDLWVEVRVVFTDKDGFAKEETNWEPILFDRRAVSTYEKTSIGAGVDGYQILFRAPKEFR